ncbi:MAG: class I SAM-dependent methyltransferase [Luteibaculaceae bacterium]
MENPLKNLYRFLSPKFQTIFLDYPVKPKPRFSKNPHPELYEIIAKGDFLYQETLKKIRNYATNLQEIRPAPDAKNPKLPHYNNGFLPGLDIFALYYFIAAYKPKRYVEVGSGNSTMVAAKAITDFNLSTKITCYDPQPRAEIKDLAAEIHFQALENANLESLLALEKGDILFIDNSHRAFPNSDVTVLFLEVIPRLKKGVLVQIHDIYLPFDYPQEMCNRFYNEQYLLATMLWANPTKYPILLPNFYISKETNLCTTVEPIFEHPNLQNVERHGGSFWFQIG